MNIIETNLAFRSLTPLQCVAGFVLHHTGDTDVDLSAEEIHQMHLNNGWSGCGYHFIFRKDGSVERGRPENMMGAHCPGANGTRLGLHICGSFAGQLPTEAQLNSLVEFLKEYTAKYMVNIMDDSVLTGHRQWLATACPGDALFNHIPAIRELVAA